MKRWLLPFQQLLPLFGTSNSRESQTVPVNTKTRRAKAHEEAAPDLMPLWQSIRQRHFPERIDLDQYRVFWARKVQKFVLASCNVRRRRVQVAPTFQAQECAPYLEALLYHEMCHAILGEPVKRRGRRVIHGKQFRELEHAHPGVAELDHWIKEGGWRAAVRRDRARRAQRLRRHRVFSISKRRATELRALRALSSAQAASSAPDRIQKRKLVGE